MLYNFEESVTREGVSFWCILNSNRANSGLQTPQASEKAMTFISPNCFCSKFGGHPKKLQSGAGDQAMETMPFFSFSFDCL